MVEYLLQNLNAGYLGNSPFFWEKNNSGYTARIDDAKVFTPAEAREVINSTRGSHKWKRWSKKKVFRVAHLTVDMQDLRK